MQFVDLGKQQERIREQVEQAIKKVLDHGYYVNGPEIGELESDLAAYVGVREAVACSSGTDALVLALAAAGEGKSGSVITTPFTFAATAEAIVLAGFEPLFVDIDPLTFNLDIAKVEEALDCFGGIVGIVPVDLFGLPCEYDALQAIAKKHDLFMVEDAAQSFGSTYRGQRCCSFGDIACTSFFPSKPLGGYGDGGMCFTDKPSLAKKMRYMLNHGQSSNGSYKHYMVGMNSRLSSIQAAVINVKFSIFPDEKDRRQMVADRYRQILSEGLSGMVPQQTLSYCRSTYAQYSVTATDQRGRIILTAALEAAGVPTRIYYKTALHLQPAFEYLDYKFGDLPVAEDVSQRIFSLPMHPYLELRDQRKIKVT